MFAPLLICFHFKSFHNILKNLFYAMEVLNNLGLLEKWVCDFICNLIGLGSNYFYISQVEQIQENCELNLSQFACKLWKY